MSCPDCDTAQETGEVAYPFRVGGPVGDEDVPFASVLVFCCPVHALVVRNDLLVAYQLRHEQRGDEDKSLTAWVNSLDQYNGQEP